MFLMTCELVGQPLDDRRRAARRPTARVGALPREVVEVAGVVGEPLRHREVGQLRLAELDGDVGALGDPQRVVARLGKVAEQVAHLRGRLEVVLLALELEPLRVAEHRPGLHAQQRVVRLVVLAVDVVRVVGGDQRRADLAGDLDQLRVGVALGLQAVVLQLDEQVVLAEDVLQPAGLVERALLVAAAAATAARARRGSRWSRSARRGTARAAPSPSAACSSSPRGRPGWRAGSGCGSPGRSRPAG